MKRRTRQLASSISPAPLHRHGGLALDELGQAVAKPLPGGVHAVRDLDEVRNEEAIVGRVFKHSARVLLPDATLLLGPPDEDLHRRHVRLPLPLRPGTRHVGVRDGFILLGLPAAGPVQPSRPCRTHWWWRRVGQCDELPREMHPQRHLRTEQ
jgi:hypothetical protein